MLEKLELTLIDWLDTHESRAGRIAGYFLVFLILLSVGSFVLETTSLVEKWGHILRGIEIGVLFLFAIEYVLRILVARDRKAFILSPLGIIDFLVILPFFGHFWNLSLLRGFRALRILQVLKAIRYSGVMISFFKSFRHYRDELKIFLTSFFLVLFLSAFGLYHFEYLANEKIQSLPDALWWAVVTMSTVGYGDVVPVTMGGKILASVIVLLGLATFAVLTAIITKIFIDHFFGKRLHHCEFCHYPHHDHDAKFCKNCGGKLDIEALDKADMIGRKH